MRRLLLTLGLALLPLITGCARNYFNVPQNSFADEVKILGVAPIMVDADSDIRYPQKGALIDLITAQNRLHEEELVRMLKKSNSFYTVTKLDADPKTLFSSLLFRRERRDDASIRYNKYFWKEEPLADLIRKNSLDAVLLVVISGITRPDKIYSPTLLDACEGDYNFLIMSAQILDAKGNILWEYPNFRTRILSYTPLLNLQYPDFDESKANMSVKTPVKFKTLEGIRKALDKRRLDLLMRETGDEELYTTQFEAMTSLLELNRDDNTTAKPAQPPQQQSTGGQKP